MVPILSCGFYIVASQAYDMVDEVAVPWGVILVLDQPSLHAEV